MEQTNLIMTWEEYKLLLEALSTMYDYTDYKPLNDLYINTFAGKHQLDITPSIFVNLWRKGSLSTDDTLGTITHNCGIGIRFWTWYGGITFMRVLNTKTAEEINKNLSKMGLNPVL